MLVLLGQNGVKKEMVRQSVVMSSQPTRDDHPDTVYSHLTVFIPAGRDYTLVFRTSCSPSI